MTMNFWQQLQTVSGVGPTSLTLGVVVFVVIALALFIFKPAERIRIRTAILLFALSLAGLMVAATLLSSGVSTSSSAYKWIRWAGRFFLWIAIVNVAGVFIFEVFLDA